MSEPVRNGESAENDAPVTRRIVTLVVDGTEASEDLRTILAYAVAPPWKPVPRGENANTYKQERWDQESTDVLLLERLKSLAPRVHWMSSSIIPPGERSDG